MTQARTPRLLKLHTGIASSLALATLVGCQTPPMATLAGAPQAQTDTGTTGESAQALEGAKRYSIADENVDTSDSTSGVVPQAGLLTATASGSAPGYPASAAVDGNTNTQWASDGKPNPTLTVILRYQIRRQTRRCPLYTITSMGTE